MDSLRGESMNGSAHDFILSEGFEGALEGLIAYAETQAKLQQSLIGGQRTVEDHRSQFLFWIRAWANLQRASDAIAFPVNDDDCLAMWQEHQEGYAGADVDFGFGQ